MFILFLTCTDDDLVKIWKAYAKKLSFRGHFYLLKIARSLKDRGLGPPEGQVRHITSKQIKPKEI